MYFRILAVFSLVLLALISRLLPHPANFTALNTIALFGSTTLGSLPLTIITTITSLFFSDLVLGGHSTQGYVYFAYVLIAVMGHYYKVNSRLKGYSLSFAASAVFFVISNFAVWLVDGFYTLDIKGLIFCYIAALPFFMNQMLGDFFYASLILMALSYKQKDLVLLNE